MTAAASKIRAWRKDANLFVRDVFGVTPDPWQEEILTALPRNMRIAMKACKGPGKTCVIAWICWWFLVCFTHPKIAATSITGDNLSDGLWAEMAKWQNKSPFLKEAFQWTKTRIFAKDHPETWWMSARTWAKGSSSEQQANTLAGLHADNIMFVIDEAGGVPDAVMAAAEAALANDHGDGKTTAKLVMAGNPTHLEGPLYRACTSERHLWYVVEITSDPDNPKRTPRVSIQWARDQIAKYGADNPWVLVNVFGRFPQSSMNTLLGPDEVEDAMNRHLSDDQFSFAQKRLGVDVARFGDDRTVLAKRQGLAVFPLIEMRGARSHDIGGRVLYIAQDWGHEVEYVDGTGGFGAGVVDYLIQAKRHPREIHFSGSPIDERYLNKRAEMWFLMSEWVKRGGALPRDPDLKRELTAVTYTMKGDKFMIEPKDLIKARIGVSPDKADAVALTFAEPEAPPRGRPQPLGYRSQHRVDYDPFNSGW